LPSERTKPHLSFPKISSGLDSHFRAESAHHEKRCLRSCTRLGCSSPTCSSRAGLKPRICFSVPTGNPTRLTWRANRVIFGAMGDLCRLIWYVVAGLFRSRAALQAEILVLRHQLNVLRRKSPKRPVFNNIDRLVFATLCGLAPNMLDALKILKPETVVRWHRAGFRAYWCWKSRPRGGRPRASAEVRDLIREMSMANGVRRGSMVSCANSGSMSARPP
jgi:hypothetical protein